MIHVELSIVPRILIEHEGLKRGEFLVVVLISLRECVAMVILVVIDNAFYGVWTVRIEVWHMFLAHL